MKRPKYVNHLLPDSLDPKSWFADVWLNHIHFGSILPEGMHPLRTACHTPTRLVQVWPPGLSCRTEAAAVGCFHPGRNALSFSVQSNICSRGCFAVLEACSLAHKQRMRTISSKILRNFDQGCTAVPCLRVGRNAGSEKVSIPLATHIQRQASFRRVCGYTESR